MANADGGVRVHVMLKHRSTWDRALVGLVFIAIAGFGVWAMSIEMDSSPVQSRLFSRVAKDMTYAVEPGPTADPRFPLTGPYDERLGYAQVPTIIESLEDSGFVIERQARLSDEMRSFMDLGGNALYQEKAQAGLVVRDRDGHDLYVARHPEFVFPDFESIPPLIVNTLLFVENRELLDETSPTRNPAIEWDRFAAAAVNVVADSIDPGGSHFGGSTLATQIEKYRHSAEGRTGSVVEKLRQITSASLRAYRNGPNTMDARYQIIADYINSTPLSARGGYGEVIGLGDGLWAWFGTDIGQARRVLADEDPQHPLDAKDQAMRPVIYKQVLALLLAQRRPSHYLLAGHDDLNELIDSHLRLLAAAGVIDDALRDQALAVPLVFRTDAPSSDPHSYLDRKALNAVRAHLLSLLQVPQFYDLDRIDATVDATLDSEIQASVMDTLEKLQDPKEAVRLGLIGEHLLTPSNVGDVVYSVTIYESTGSANLMRVQADNLDRPLDLNEGGKLDLGSTAKLRTLVSYLEIIAELHDRYVGLSRAELAKVAEEVEDPLSAFVVDYFLKGGATDLQSILDAAMARRYSASPGESFFTGRGLHTFVNFDKTFNGRIMPVSEAFRYSVNLPFIRIMRDIVRFYLADGPEPARAVLDQADHPARQEYLERFADNEGSVYLSRFFRRYRGLTPDEALDKLADRTRPIAHRLAVVFRSVRPDASVADFTRFMKAHLPGAGLDSGDIERLYFNYGVDRFNLQDRGYIARIHPLELWLVAYLQDHPDTTRKAMLAASTDTRQEAYQWLFKSKRKGAANSKIRILLEEEAFRKIHQSWQRLGYPFSSLVPSYATAIGSSADRPAALAELMGIIVNDGRRLPTVRINAIHLAEGTPFETQFVHPGNEGERVLPHELVVTVRRALRDVVENGTARRVSGAFVDAKRAPIPVGGKTGTGDDFADHPVNRGSMEVGRSAAFVFYIGDRFFGVVTAHVPAAMTGHYKFTSALPSQVLKALAPALQPLLQKRDSDRPTRQQIMAGSAPGAQ